MLISPHTGRPLRLVPDPAGGDCQLAADGERFAVREGIPRFVEDEAYAESFGYQWTEFEVRQPAEDAATFAAKVGVRPQDLAGQWVLDAGCGGGRYALIAGQCGARVIGVDRSRAVDKARSLCHGLENVGFLQADLTELPLPENAFDLVFSIGVLHHAADPRRAFELVARRVKRGGRLSIWVYRRNSWVQEQLNGGARWLAQRLSRRALLACCRGAAVLGGIPGVNRTLNKIVNFSNHPRRENRVCDNFDWYSPRYQFHYLPAEIIDWFAAAGFAEIRTLAPEKQGRLYFKAYEAGLIVGSGVNVTAIRR
jgi:SAM-dependent methyltransferase